MSSSSSHSLPYNYGVLESSLQNGGVHSAVTNLCEDLDHLGVVGLTYIKELPPPLFGINQEQPLLLGRPLLLQRLLIEHQHY